MKTNSGKIKGKTIKGNKDSDKKIGRANEGASTSEIMAKANTEAEVQLTVPVDLVEARKSIATLVRMSANEIAKGLIEHAKSGELAPTKYLFELVGLYPATPETSSKPENSLAYALLKRMGLPTDPVPAEEDAEAALHSRAVDPVAGAESCGEETWESEFDGDRDDGHGEI
jgi:hypothetical protein